MFKKILLCTDGSDRSVTAAGHAAELANVHGAELITLHVAQVPTISAPFVGAPAISEQLIEIYIRDIHRAVFERTLTAINEHGVFTKTIGAVGEPVNAILQTAEAQECDLIVMGSRGVSAARANQVDSVSIGVMHSAPCPVLLVR